MSTNTNRTNYVCNLDAAQRHQLYRILRHKGWTLDRVEHSEWRARQEKTTVVAYESGKVVIQGKGTPELVRYTLEPEILKEARFGYEDVHLKQESPEMFEPHAGVDEAGKGDYFGPLVIVAVYVDPDSAHALARLQVADSKSIKSDKRVCEFAEQIRETLGQNYDCIPIGPEAYNRNYEKMGNVNRLLAWGHARALENLLEKVPECPRAVADQFATASTLRNALLTRGQRIELTQVPRAEADIAVAAASILARAEFVERLKKLGERAGVTLPKGAGPGVDKVASQIMADQGEHQLAKFAKMHFRTTEKVRSRLHRTEGQ